jgi:hypothetical protein
VPRIPMTLMRGWGEEPLLILVGWLVGCAALGFLSVARREISDSLSCVSSTNPSSRRICYSSSSRSVSVSVSVSASPKYCKYSSAYCTV